MALNQIYGEAYSLPYNFGTSDPSVSSGDFVVIGGLRGVAETDAVERPDGDWYATVRHIGVFKGTTADAVTVGAAVYLASSATVGTALTTTATDNDLVGYAIAAKGAGAGDVWVRINS